MRFSSVNPLDVISALNAGPFHALAQIYSHAEFRTSVSPTIDIDVASLDSGDSAASPSLLLQLLRPTIILSGPAGTKVIAPAGEAGESGGLTGLLFLAGIFGVPFLLGYGFGKSRRPKR